MENIAAGQSAQEIVQSLGEQVRRLQGARPVSPQTRVSTGCAALDRLLPGGGLSRGTLIEWLSGSAGSGASSLALLAAREACQTDGVLVVMDRRRTFYPPAAAALGIDLGRTVVIRAGSDEDDRWALDQAIRCSGVAAVLCWPEKLDGRSFRRLQLAAETSGCLGLLVRPAAVRGEPSWAQTRWLVEPLATAGPRRLRVRLLRCRAGGGLSGDEKTAELEIDEHTGTARGAHALPLAAQLAHPATRRRAAGA